MKSYTGWLMLGFIALTCGLYAAGEAAAPVVGLRRSNDAVEVERLIASAHNLPVQRRIEFVSKYLIGRRYHPATKKRIKKQRSKPVEKVEASNPNPLPVKILPTSLTYLDCMTYVEHVLALAANTKPAHYDEFLCRLIDIMYNAGGQPLMNHHRNHFTSRWGDVNEQKGYLVNVARSHPLALSRELYLNRVGDNRTFYVEDRFVIAEKPQLMWYFPRTVALEKKAPLLSGDVVALVTDKEGLDVTHMGFFIEKKGKRFLRHASFKLNRIVDQDFEQYLRENKHVGGLMVFRPLLNSPAPYKYSFNRLDKPADPR
ncbi:MAG: hypothetical protein CVV42_00490 [Candidatus Riflebacteria bacterium HGW-Riflebacteria-2]|nr:MAG: hypothetical protein CVV42_00490 [Candidatus Riflebacteria bacterium HGW-Riflebacteria-2]